MHALLLAVYVALPLVTLWRSRSVAWTVIALLTSISVMGVAVNFVIDHIGSVTWLTLQLLTLVALLVPAILAFVIRPPHLAPRRRQFLAVLLPVLLLGLFFVVMTTWWTQAPALQTPMSYLMGHAIAEDNAKWLDFAALLAAGAPIDQAVPLGGPLQLVLTVVATAMAAASTFVYGGVNEVMVAANTVVFSQYLFVALAPLALAPIAEFAYRARRAGGGVRTARVPAPLIWAGSVILVAAVLMATAYGHLTWQYTVIAVTLWIATYLVELPIPRARLATSLVVVASMTVWLPMNVIALVLLVGWIVVIVRNGVRHRSWDWISIALVVLVTVSVAQPMLSSFAFLSAASSSASGTGFGAGGISAGVIVAFIDATLLAATGGTEVAGPLLVVLAVTGAVGAAWWGDRHRDRSANYTRFIPVALLAGFTVALQVLDQWLTGTAPNYGSSKFTFLAAIAIAAGTMPVALLMLSERTTRMTALRWVGVGAVVFTLTADSLLVRAVAEARPERWSPAIPFNNPQSYWWPADVNGTAEQPIASNPVGCVYLPQGAKAPSAILDSQLSDAQRVYNCTRLLAGLAGEDAGAQPLVDWLRREWLTNQRAWEGVYGYLADMPDDVLDRPIILLDDGSNVSGLESMRSLLARFPADAWSR